MDKTREALESARGYIWITKAMYGVAADPHLEKIDEALAALSAPVASDAREATKGFPEVYFYKSKKIDGAINEAHAVAIAKRESAEPDEERETLAEIIAHEIEALAEDPAGGNVYAEGYNDALPDCIRIVHRVCARDFLARQNKCAEAEARIGGKA